MYRIPSPRRSVATAIVATGAVVISSGAAIAAATAADPAVNKAQVGYTARPPTQYPMSRDAQAMSKYIERTETAQPASVPAVPAARIISFSVPATASINTISGNRAVNSQIRGDIVYRGPWRVV